MKLINIGDASVYSVQWCILSTREGKIRKKNIKKGVPFFNEAFKLKLVKSYKSIEIVVLLCFLSVGFIFFSLYVPQKLLWWHSFMQISGNQHTHRDVGLMMTWSAFTMLLKSSVSQLSISRLRYNHAQQTGLKWAPDGKAGLAHLFRDLLSVTAQMTLYCLWASSEVFVWKS